MFIIPSIDLSMKLSLSEVFVSNIIVTMVISNKSCCKHVLFTNLSDFISTTTRVTSLKSKKFLFCSFSVAKFGIAPMEHHHTPSYGATGRASSKIDSFGHLAFLAFIIIIIWTDRVVIDRVHLIGIGIVRTNSIGHCFVFPLPNYPSHQHRM